MDIIKEFVETVRLALSANIQAFSMVASLRGTARTHAIYRGTGVLVELNGSVPAEGEATLEGRNADDEQRAKKASECKDWLGLTVACSVLAILDDEFGLWEGDEGIAGAIRYQIECNTPKASEDDEDALFGSDHDAMRQRAEMANTLANLERFGTTTTKGNSRKARAKKIPSDLENLIGETQMSVMCDLDNAPLEVDWIGQAIGKSAKKQKFRMREQYRKGLIKKSKIMQIVEHLDAMAWVATH
jgi:hypothetical protein